jgi:hypothetical protein
METLGDAVDRLSSAGYRDAFRLEPAGLRALAAQRLFAPEELAIDEIVRFEGESDPGDEAIVLALRSGDGAVRGTLTLSYGTGLGSAEGELFRRLPRPKRPARPA